MRRVLVRIQRLPPWAMALVVLLGSMVVVGGGIAGYRTYDFIEHDNEFCLSCHLMEEPFQRFARSEHRGLGCKACHKPTFAARSQMALTQVIEAPDTLAAHAEVPNDKCASCHIEGDPQKWETIRNSAGHRIHLESSDSVLQGLRCVECHSSGVHEFTPADETCAQSGCHSDSRIRLGRMSDLTIHCAACHGFSTPVDPSASPEALASAVRPDAQECLSCHVMRTLVDMPSDEPHQRACGACHDAHEHESPAEAVQTCATAACHARPDTVSPMHRGMEPGALEECASCHEAHDWSLEEATCLSCHEDVVLDGARAQRGAVAVHPASPQRTGPYTLPTFLTAVSAVHGPAAGTGGPSASMEPAPARHAVSRGSRPQVQAAPPRPDSVFRHAQHRGVDCLTCHSTEEAHGRVTVTTLQDCRSCHHTEPVKADCTACHSAEGAPRDTYPATRTLSFTVKDAESRELPFDHGLHADLSCAGCHTSGLELSADTVVCSSCHEDHHQPEVRCASCHSEAAAEQHPSDEVHLGCSGTGCHQDVPVPGVPRTRPFCLTCHQALEDHRPGRECEACHQLPPPRASGGGS